MKLNNLFTDEGRLGTALQYSTALVLLLLVYLTSMSMYRGWATWFVNLPALVIIGATAVARAYDISQRSKRWFVRRMGFVLVGTSALAIAASPVMGYADTFLSWRETVFSWGFALCWLTTPGQPPWWKYISSRDKVKELHDATAD